MSTPHSSNQPRYTDASPECFLVTADALVLSVLSKYRAGGEHGGAADGAGGPQASQSLPTAA